jgi:hypothetical protein
MGLNMRLQRREMPRSVRLADELRHLITGRHSGCELDPLELRDLWQRHRAEVEAEFARGHDPRHGEFVPWAAIVFDRRRGQVRPEGYPYHHLRVDQHSKDYR